MLYVTDLSECDSPFGALKELVSLQKKLFDRVVFALPVSLQKRASDLPDPGIPFTTKTLPTLSFDAIVAAAREDDVSSIIIDCDTAAHEAMLHQLASNSPLPVLVLDRNVPTHGLLSHVIFATDWSLPSEKAMDQILACAELIYELDIIHVISEKLTVKGMRELKERLEHTRKICLSEGINAESHIYAGEVVEEIITASEDYRGTVIVVGADSRRTFTERVFRRSKVCSLLQQAAVPVFFVPFAAEGD